LRCSRLFQKELRTTLENLLSDFLVSLLSFYNSIHVLGKNATNVSQISNDNPPIRKQPDSLGHVDLDLKAASFLLFSVLYCKKDYYSVDMRPVYFNEFVCDFI
jgi:hypothetical protein